MQRKSYGSWEGSPHVAPLARPVGPRAAPDLLGDSSPLWRDEATKHEGSVLYHRQWNFWVRAGTGADAPSDYFFRDYERTDAATDALLRSVGFPWRKAETEEEVWDRIGMVWRWLGDHVRDNGAEYAAINSAADGWPSILDFGRFHHAEGHLAWASCFSKAHLFATLLGRMVYPRYRFALASAHHTENGAPPTATHVYVAAYVADRWYYLDPTAVHDAAFPAFSSRASIGVQSFDTVDYEHPYKVLPVPLSGLVHVPLLT